MKRSIVLSVSSFDLLGPAARTLEAAGLDRAWVTEIPGRDAIVRAVHTANQTNSIAVGTGIAYAFTRHPIAMASAALEANTATGGRVTLGIGAGPADFRTNLGIEFDKPAARLGEYIEFVKAALTARDGLHFDGEFYQARLPGYASTVPADLRDSIDVYGSGVNPLVLRTMARVADGIALHPLGLFRPYLDSVVLPAITSGSAGRHIKIATWCVASIDENRNAALIRARTRLALYLANPAFARVLADTEWSNVPKTLTDAAKASSPKPDWNEIGSLLPNELVEVLSVVGTPDEATQKLAGLQTDLSARGVDELALQVPSMGGSDTQLLAEIDALASAVS